MAVHNPVVFVNHIVHGIIIRLPDVFNSSSFIIMKPHQNTVCFLTFKTYDKKTSPNVLIKEDSAGNMNLGAIFPHCLKLFYKEISGIYPVRTGGQWQDTLCRNRSHFEGNACVLSGNSVLVLHLPALYYRRKPPSHFL